MELRDKKLFCLDMDGTIYLDHELFDGTLDFLARVKEKGGKYLFLTNNSSKSVSAYVEKLARIGIPAVEEDFVTSTDASIQYIKEHHPDLLFYAMGTRSFVSQLRAAGIRITTDFSMDIEGVITSNDTELTFKKLDDVSHILTVKDVVYLATNPDPCCPASYGRVPDCGCFSEMLRTATGKYPRFLGKPRPEMLYTAMKTFGYTKEQTVMVGDMLGTDILAGNQAGVDSVLLFSGGTDRATAEKSPIRATYAFDNIRALWRAIQ